jgi:predicted ATPase
LGSGLSLVAEATQAENLCRGALDFRARLSFGQGLAYRLMSDVLLVVGLPNSDCADCEPEMRQALYSLTQNLFGEGMLNVYPFLGHMLSLDIEAEMLQQVQTNDPRALQTQYLEALRRLFLVLAKRKPLVLVLEDLHWADPSSVELLIKLLPLIFTAPILLCMSMRPDHNSTGWKLVSAARENLGSSLSEITLSALTDLDARQLVANLLAIEDLPEQMRSLILRKAEGNPFFVEEVIRMMIDRGIVVQKNGGWAAASEITQVDIPDNLQGLLQARIDRLPDDVKYTLLVASVIGRQFPVRVLEEVLERSKI